MRLTVKQRGDLECRFQSLWRSVQNAELIFGTGLERVMGKSTCRYMSSAYRGTILRSHAGESGSFIVSPS